MYIQQYVAANLPAKTEHRVGAESRNGSRQANRKLKPRHPGRPYRRLGPTPELGKFSEGTCPNINFEKILQGARGNFEEKNKVLATPVIIMNYYIIIINVYYNYTA